MTVGWPGRNDGAMSISIARSVALLLIVSSFSACALLQKAAKAANPEIVVKDITIKELTLDGVGFHINAELKNNLPVPLPATSLKVDVLVNDKKLTALTTAPVSVGASTSAPLPFDVVIRYADLGGVVKSMADIPSWKLGLKGSMEFHVDLPALPPKINVPFSVEKTVPAFLPEISVDSVQLRHPDLTSMLGNLFTKEIKLGLDLAITVKNRGGARFSVRQMNYSMNIEGRELFQGNTTGASTSADGRSTSVKTSTEISVQESLQSIVKALQKKSIPYQLKGSLGLDFPGVDFKQYQLPLNKDGQITL